MLLVIDSGNTNCVFAAYKGSELLGQWRLVTDVNRSPQQYKEALEPLLAQQQLNLNLVDGVAISNVVMDGLSGLVEFSQNHLHCDPLVVGDANVNLGLNIAVEAPNKVGTDRLVNIVAAYRRHKTSAIIIDFGTATTFDVMNVKGDFCGGVIAPGIELSLHALQNIAPQLPKINVNKPKKTIGTSTSCAMESGIYYGYIGLVENIVKHIKQEYGQNMTVIATGGLAPLLVDAIDIIDHLESDLTIEGLHSIYDLNQNLNDLTQNNKKSA